MKKNKKVLLVISNEIFNANRHGIGALIKQFPKRIPTWKDFDFEIVPSLRKRKSDQYDYVVFYTDYKFGRWAYQPFPFVSELYRIQFKKVLFVGFEGSSVGFQHNNPTAPPEGYNPVYTLLFQEWPYQEFEAFVLQKDFNYKKTHLLNFIPYPTYLVMGDYSDTLDYDFFKEHSPSKTKPLVIISSNENYAPAHEQRMAFSHQIKEYYQDKVDFFGRGFNSFHNKYHTLSPYKYMIVIENGVQENYWTEKLLDAYLSECYPIYFGCPNVTDFFDKDSLSIIDIYDFEAAVKTIDHVIANNFFEKKYPKLLEAKKQCLTKYHLFEELRNCCLRLR